MNPDPIEELSEVYSEVQQIENEFGKALGVAKHLLAQSRSLFSNNGTMTE